MMQRSEARVPENIPPSSHDRQRGSVLAIVMFVLILGGLLSVALIATTTTRGQAIGESVQVSRATYAAEGAINFAYSAVWDAYLADVGGEAGDMDDYRSFLSTTMALADGSSIDLTADVPDLGVTLSSVTVTREDISGDLGVSLTAEVIVDEDGTELIFRETFQATGADFDGLQFALLTNDVKCIFCHVDVGSTAKYSSDSYPKIKVASLEALQVRGNKAHSTIAGDLFVRGEITDIRSKTLDLKKITLDSVKVDGDGNVVTDAHGRPIREDLQVGKNTFLEANKEAYEDAEVPDAFPPVFPDDNDNGLIDDSEYAAVRDGSPRRDQWRHHLQRPTGWQLRLGLAAGHRQRDRSGRSCGEQSDPDRYRG